MNRLLVTVLGIVAAVGISGLVFVGINKLFDLTHNRYTIFSAAAGGLLSAVLFGLLWGNRLVESPIWVLVAAIIGAGMGFALGSTEARERRLMIGIAGGAGLGLLAGFTAVETVAPSIEIVPTVVWLLVGAAIGFAVWVIGGRRGDIVRNVLFGTAFGWLFGAWLSSEFTGSRSELIIVTLVLGALIGAALGRSPHPDKIRRSEIALSSRKYIFLTPALLFVVATLVIPLGRTIWLGFLTGNLNDLKWTGLTQLRRHLLRPRHHRLQWVP